MGLNTNEFNIVVFDIDSKKAVTKNIKPSRACTTLILSKGNVLLFVDPKENEQYNLITQINLKEISAYFRHISDYNLSNQNAYHFFKNHLTREISKHIMSFAHASEIYNEAYPQASRITFSE